MKRWFVLMIVGITIAILVAPEWINAEGLDRPQLVPQVEVVNFPTDDTGAIRVSSSRSECDCLTETLVVQMVDEYRLGHDEEFVTEQIDLLDFYGGQIHSPPPPSARATTTSRP